MKESRNDEQRRDEERGEEIQENETKRQDKTGGGETRTDKHGEEK